MENNKEVLTLSDIVDICNSDVSNWIESDTSFPKPLKKTPAESIWKTEDIIDYLYKKEDSSTVISKANLKTKTIAIIGRARSGKSFFNSRFVKDRVGFTKLFCGNNIDKTVCPIYIQVSESTLLENFTFHTDFNSIYNESDSKEIAALKDKVTELTKHRFIQSNIFKMEEIENVIREIREIEQSKRYSNREKVSFHINTYQKPSLFCEELLKECDLDDVQIIDTPGVSGNVEAKRVAKSDIYIFLIKPDNSDEAQTLKDIVTQIKADVATSKVAFLYKKEGLFLTLQKYKSAQNSVKEDIMAFSDLFSDLKGNIIATELDVLNPSKHCILFPTMDADEVTLPEELFLQDIKKKLIEAFKPADEKEEDEIFKNIVCERGDEAETLVLNIMEGITKHTLKKDMNDYDENDIIKEKHDRVMTNDHYILRNDLYAAYNQETKLLNNYFSKFKEEEYPEDWKQKIIKYIYKRLTQSVRQDRGLGVGFHPLEEYPARTMLVEESIFADRVLSSIESEEKKMNNESYRKALGKVIESSSWNYVECVDNPERIIKLEIVKNYLSQIKVHTRQDLVLCRYVGGLRQIAQYKILKLMGKEDTVAMDILREMPF
jgi:hypothetical protein